MDNDYSKNYEDWLMFADEDLEFATESFKEHDKFFSMICYHFQQAGEKYLKAFIIKNKLPFEKTHNLKRLIAICASSDNEFNDFTDEASLLTSYYNEIKYPVDWGFGIKKEQVDEVREAAKEIGEFVKKKIAS